MRSFNEYCLWSADADAGEPFLSGIHRDEVLRGELRRHGVERLRDRVVLPGCRKGEFVDSDGAVGMHLGDIVECDHDCLSGRLDFEERLSRADTPAVAEASIPPDCTASDTVSR